MMVDDEQQFQCSMSDDSQNAIDRIKKLKNDLKKATTSMPKYDVPTPMSPDNFSLIPYFKSAVDNKIEPIIPDGYFEKQLEYQAKSLDVLKAINEVVDSYEKLLEIVRR